LSCFYFFNAGPFLTVFGGINTFSKPQRTPKKDKMRDKKLFAQTSSLLLFRVELMPHLITTAKFIPNIFFPFLARLTPISNVCSKSKLPSTHNYSLSQASYQ